MDINLRLLSGEHVKEDEEPDVIDHMLNGEDKLQSGEGSHGIMMDIGDDLNLGDGENITSPATDMLDYKTDVDVNLEPLSGMEFASHGEAYSFYQEYARSMGFNTAIQNSRRSKTSREFIDAKFACSRYGTKREYEKPYNRQRSRQECKQDIENSTGRRSYSKTDCKACMHVKRRSDGKWIIHRFEKEHNHELLPAQAVSEQTRKMYAAMARQFAEYKSVVGLKSDSKTPFEKGRNLVLEVGEAKMLLDFCTHMQSVNSNFFYSADISDDQRLKSLFWVDAKSRHDYVSFSDVVSFDTTYVRNKYKMPLILFIGVNQHYQFMLLGCALVADDNASTLSWVLQTWLKAMGGHAPKVIISDQDQTLKSIIGDALPTSYHCYCLWHIFGKVSDTLSHLIKQHGSFLLEFEECIYRSWTKEEFEKRWQNWVERYDLKENEWIQSLYEDRTQWVPTYLKDTFLGGMFTAQRSESVNSFFDKYMHKKTSIQEFLKQYDVILQERYEEEAKADSDSWNRTLTFKSPSPFEKHLSGKYTNAVLRKFQTEVLGAVACIPKREGADEETSIEPVIFRVQDYEKDQEFTVSWSASKSEVSCVCRLYEFKGFLCRHALIVLQICGLSTIPSQYILRRWTKDAKQRPFTGEASEHVQSRMQRYNNLFQRAMVLVEEGSLSQESYNFSLRALEDAFVNCLGVNNSSKNLTESATSPTAGLLCIEEGNQSRSMSANNKKKNPTKKRKVNSEQDVMTMGPQESFQHMDKLSSRTPPFDSYFPQQNIPGMVQLNLMAAPTRDSYYGNHQTIQGLGQLSSMAPNHDGYYSSQPSMHGMGQMDFFRAQTSFAYGVREESSVRSSQLHDEASRHA